MFSAVGKHWGWRTSLGAQDFGDPAALVLLHLFFFFTQSLMSSLSFMNFSKLSEVEKNIISPIVLGVSLLRRQHDYGSS